MNNMNLTDVNTIKDLLKRHGAKAEKYLGQHFILSDKALSQMISAAEIKKNETVVEIGPGLGALTQKLAKTEAKIIAIEKDPLMMNILEETLTDYKNVKAVNADARRISMLDIGEKYKIVANLPYNVATFLIRQWLESEKPPETMVLMVQKEVAQRICSIPPHMNLLAASVQFYAEVKIIDYVKKGSFWPQPKIDSAIIQITPIEKSPQETRDAFFKVVKAGFSQPRKQLIGNLIKNLKLGREELLNIFKDSNIPEQARAENLSLDQWLNLADKI